MFLLLVLVQVVYPNNSTAPETTNITQLKETVLNEELLHKISGIFGFDFVYVALLEDP